MSTNSAAPIIDMTAAERDAIFREDFMTFAYAAFAVLYPTSTLSFEWFHEAVAAVLAIVGTGQRVRHIINAPPRSLKSFLVSSAWPAFKLGHHPSFQILCASYSQDLANTFSADCRRLMESSFYHNLFPTRLAKSTEDELRTSAGGFRIAKSVNSTLTGLGGDALIIDDPLSANDIWSEPARNNANEWFTRNLMQRLNDKAKGDIIVVMQRLHQDDLTGHLLQKGGWEHLVLPAIALKDMAVWLGDRDHLWRVGEPLQTREGLDLLAELKVQIGAETFNAQHLQEPLPETGNLLDPAWLKWYEQAPIRQPGDQFVQSWDTAHKSGPTNDYSVCITFLIRNNNHYYVLDVFRKQMDFTQLCDAAQAQARTHQPDAVLIEEHASDTPLIVECKRRGMATVIGRRPNKDKRTRMAGETPKLQAGSLILPKAAPWLGEFRVEYLASRAVNMTTRSTRCRSFSTGALSLRLVAALNLTSATMIQA